MHFSGTLAKQRVEKTQSTTLSVNPVVLTKQTKMPNCTRTKRKSHSPLPDSILPMYKLASQQCPVNYTVNFGPL